MIFDVRLAAHRARQMAVQERQESMERTLVRVQTTQLQNYWAMVFPLETLGSGLVDRSNSSDDVSC